MAFSFKKRDLLLIAVAVAILAFLWQAPPESTSRVPDDEIHHPFIVMVKSEGKKAAEKHCDQCHNENGVPFPPEHPPKSRCLFCHKISSR